MKQLILVALITLFFIGQGISPAQALQLHQNEKVDYIFIDPGETVFLQRTAGDGEWCEAFGRCTLAITPVKTWFGMRVIVSSEATGFMNYGSHSFRCVASTYEHGCVSKTLRISDIALHLSSDDTVILFLPTRWKETSMPDTCHTTLNDVWYACDPT